jgi:DNA-binding transcriptional ArsR family regulator
VADGRASGLRDLFDDQTRPATFDIRRTMQVMEAAAAKADPLDASPTGGSGEPATGELDLPAILQALSDPIRMRIVAELAQEDERTCSSFDLPIVKSTATHHFRVLRECGVIYQRTVGTTRINCLRRQELDSQFPGLLDAVLKAAGKLGTPVNA